MLEMHLCQKKPANWVLSTEFIKTVKSLSKPSQKFDLQGEVLQAFLYNRSCSPLVSFHHQSGETSIEHQKSFH